MGLVLFLLLLSGCNHAPGTPMRLGTNVWPGYEPLYLAREFGYIDREDVQLVELNSATQVMRAFRNGALEAAAAAPARGGAGGLFCR